MRKFLFVSLLFYSLIFCGVNALFAQGFLVKDREVQSIYDQQDIVVDEVNKIIYFTVANHPNNSGGVNDLGDVWAVSFDEFKFSSQPFRVTSDWNNEDRNQLLALQANKAFLNNHYDKIDNFKLRKGVSKSRFSNENWHFPLSVKISSYRNDSDSQSACISRDGAVMILSTQSYGTYGVEDLYVSFLQKNETWSTPRNLGSIINTENQEMSPYLNSDASELYFVSNGHGGFGSKDVFVSKRLDDTFLNWSTPKNLGNAVNSVGMETSFALLPNTNFAVISTTNNSKGMGDLRIVPFSHHDQGVQTSTVAENDSIVSDSNHLNIVTLNSKDSSRLVSVSLNAENQWLDSTYYSSVNGKIDFLVSKTSFPFYVWFEKKGFEPKRMKITEEAFVAETIVLLSPLELGEEYLIPDILFSRGTSELVNQDATLTSLKGLIKILESNESLKVEIGGHTDSRGSSVAKNRLSLDRANRIKKLLLKSIKLKSSRITTKGYGSNKPIASNKNEEGRMKNRRVSFKLLNK